MRLTLRTLLAYIDDTLEPQQAREIGQKVAESAPARELIERIRQVVRRRRLAAPTVAAGDPDFDANSVAQYLDSSLPDEEITILEEKCLADDQRLAEVASCHQILTLVLGEPARVPPTARARMYELVRDPVQAARRKVRVQGLGDPKVPASGHEEADEKLLLGLPQSTGGGMSFWTPFLAGCLLVGGGVALWMSMGGFGRRELTALASTDRKGVVAPPEKQPIEPVSRPNKNSETAGKIDPIPGPNKNPETAGKPEIVKEKDPPVVKDPPVGKDPVPEKVPPVAVIEKPVVPANPVAGVERPPMTSPPGTQRIEMGKPILLAGIPNLLLERDPNRPSWTRLPPEKSRVWSTDQLLVLPGYRGEVLLDSGVQLVLWGGTPELAKSALPLFEAQVTINTQPGLDLDMVLERGRVLIANKKKAGPALVRVRFGKEVWDLTLYDPNAELGIEMLATCGPYSGPAAKEASKDTSELDVALLVFKGEVGLKIRHEEFLMQPSTIVTWDGSTELASRPSAIPKLPDWYVGKNTPSTAAAREAVQALENLGRVSTTKPLDVALGECLRSTDAATRVLAVRSLAATSDVSALFSAMGDDKHPEVRTAAVEGLRHLLAVNPNTASDIARVAKEKNATDKQVSVIRQLLQGFAPEQWADPQVRATIVDYLLHDKLFIRQLALSLLLRTYPEGQKVGYDPSADVRKRERACEEWKAVVQPPKKVG